MPEAARGDAYANAMRNSGAARMLLPYRVHRAGYAQAVEAAQQAVGSTGNPVTDVSYAGDVLTVSYADGTTEDFSIAGGTGEDQTARDSAATAQARADEAYTTAEDAETTAETNRDGIRGARSHSPRRQWRAHLLGDLDTSTAFEQALASRRLRRWRSGPRGTPEHTLNSGSPFRRAGM